MLNFQNSLAEFFRRQRVKISLVYQLFQLILNKPPRIAAILNNAKQKVQTSHSGEPWNSNWKFCQIFCNSRQSAKYLARSNKVTLYNRNLLHGFYTDPPICKMRGKPSPASSARDRLVPRKDSLIGAYDPAYDHIFISTSHSQPPAKLARRSPSFRFEIDYVSNASLSREHLDDTPILVSRDSDSNGSKGRHVDQVICNLSIRCPEPRRSFHRGVDSWVTFPCQPVASFCSWNSPVY